MVSFTTYVEGVFCPMQVHEVSFHKFVTYTKCIKPEFCTRQISTAGDSVLVSVTVVTIKTLNGIKTLVCSRVFDLVFGDWKSQFQT